MAVAVGEREEGKGFVGGELGQRRRRAGDGSEETGDWNYKPLRSSAGFCSFIGASRFLGVLGVQGVQLIVYCHGIILESQRQTAHDQPLRFGSNYIFNPNFF
jgi:hypothetical protein